MIFYPIVFLGVPIKQLVITNLYGIDVLQPLGYIGWQGIVPAKAAQMSDDIVNLVTNQLLSISEAFGRLDPKEIASLMRYEMPVMGLDVGREVITEQLPIMNLALGTQTYLRMFSLRMTLKVDSLSCTRGRCCRANSANLAAACN